ncbi:hypothetical protein ElyMa_004680500 [Elysia marginata]|uniref:Uncharacterized protein n=1 Tax=Elysia marginata TaxID=1093978 RepID=A0AAV4I8E5_9GAST|nr:hypothetical protein ElyMa_004680500 [Elysia marginata]
MLKNDRDLNISIQTCIARRGEKVLTFVISQPRRAATKGDNLMSGELAGARLAVKQLTEQSGTTSCLPLMLSTIVSRSSELTSCV